MPKRIQRQRVKGWRMPENAVYVGRPTIFGNPFTLTDAKEIGKNMTERHEAVVGAFRMWLTGEGVPWWNTISRDWLHQRKLVLLNRIPDLFGYDLACWCALEQPCHADVLLEVVAL